MSLSENDSHILTTATSTPAPTIGSNSTSTQATTKQSTEALKDVVFGSIAGTCGKIIEYPFDTIKVRLQSQPAIAGVGTGGIFYTGPLDCFRKSLASGGIRSLYRGVSAPIFGAAVETSSLFFSYRVTQEVLCSTVYPHAKKDGKIELPFGALLVAGAASGAFTSLLLTPIELVKCQMQAELGEGIGTRHKNPFGVIAAVWKHNGFLGFWTGQMGTLIRETGGSAAWFGSYEGVGAALRRWDLTRSLDEASRAPVWHQLVAGACAGVSYNFIFYPADTIKSRIQTAQIETAVMETGGSGSTFWSVGRQLFREGGIRAYYKGCGITVARSAPSSAIIFTIFEWLQARFA